MCSHTYSGSNSGMYAAVESPSFFSLLRSCSALRFPSVATPLTSPPHTSSPHRCTHQIHTRTNPTTFYASLACSHHGFPYQSRAHLFPSLPECLTPYKNAPAHTVNTNIQAHKRRPHARARRRAHRASWSGRQLPRNLFPRGGAPTRCGSLSATSASFWRCSHTWPGTTRSGFGRTRGRARRVRRTRRCAVFSVCWGVFIRGKYSVFFYLLIASGRSVFPTYHPDSHVLPVYQSGATKT